MTPQDAGASSADALVVAVGGGIGALVVHTPATFSGAEIEVVPEAGGVAPTHTVVHERRLGGGRRVFAGVFPSLPAGRYLFSAGCGPRPPVTVPDGGVVEVDWR
ncbi:MAG: phospholipase [Acidimicrobiales bacterium]